MTRTRTAGLLGGLAGVVVLGAAAGLTAERYAVGRVRLGPDPDRDEPFFSLAADRSYSVTADDGVSLHVDEVGPVDAALTVVLCHGYTQQSAVWHYQRLALAAEDSVRLVLWDQRSHGRSGRSSPEHSTIDQLGRDLQAVLAAVSPAAQVVLVGQSMGGMTIMALADQRPELFGTTVTGVALMSTSTGKMAQLTFGLPAVVSPVTRRALPWLTRGMTGRPQLFERGRRMGTDLAFMATRRGAFGDTDVSPSLVAFVEQMTAECPVEVIAAFYPTFLAHDKLAALDVLRDVETLLLVGTKDRITPPAHTQAMAAALPAAHVVEVEGAGHMVQLERPELVSLQLQALLRRASRARR